jgi:hypothetical protein
VQNQQFNKAHLYQSCVPPFLTTAAATTTADYKKMHRLFDALANRISIP